MQTHVNAQIAGRSFHFLEVRPSWRKLRPSSGKLCSSCGFVSLEQFTKHLGNLKKCSKKI